MRVAPGTCQETSVRQGDVPAASGPTPKEVGVASVAPEISTDLLEVEICRLAGQLAAATCHRLELIAEFDERDGAAAWGMASTAQWLSFRCALSPAAAREHVRVARSLSKLPILRDHFASGTLSYSQARAISRVAIRLPEVEAELVEHARHMSAAQLEDLCRGINTGDRDDRPVRRARRYLRRYYDDDGWLVIHGRIPPEEGALIDAALNAWHGDDPQQHNMQDQETDAPESLEAGLGRDAVEGARVLDNAVDETDLQIAASEGVPDQEVAAIVHEDVADNIGNVVADALPGDVNEDDDPEASPRSERDAADALVAMAEALLAYGIPATRADRYQVVIELDARLLGDDALGTCRIAGGGPALHPDTVRRLLCQATTSTMLVNGPFEVLNLGRASRDPNTAQRRALLRRDQGRCRFPGCRARRHVEAHHIVWWSRGGRTDLSNLILLCRFHHTLVHEAGYRISVNGPAAFAFYRPDGATVTKAPLFDQSADGSTQSADGSRVDPRPMPPFDPAITAETLPPKWGADRGQFDYAYAVSCFLDAAQNRRLRAKGESAA